MRNVKIGFKPSAAGAVADEQSVVVCVVVERAVPRDDVHAGTAFDQAADLVVLEAAVDGADPR